MSDFRILSDREHVLKRPAMYIGSTAFEPHERFLFGEYKTVSYVPGLVKIIDEIIDNSVDEAIRTEYKFANAIIIDIANNIVKIQDNGRGIPQDMIQTPEGTEIPKPVAAWTKTKAGSNFDDTQRVTAGMNGVGSSLTNFFSAWFKGVTCDGKNTLTVNCTDGAANVSWTSTSGGQRGTSVEFSPDFEHFEGMTIDQAVIDIIHDRIQSLSVIFPKIAFKFNGKKVQGKFKTYAQQFGKDVVIQENDNCSVAITNSPDGFRQVSFVNGLHTKNGGSHVDSIIDGLAEELIPSIKRKFRIEVTKSRIKECLTVVQVVRNMSNMRFDSQTKERLTNPAGEIKNHLDFDTKKLAKTVLNTESVLMPIIEAALARKLAAEAAAATKAQKKAQRAKVAKHLKANDIGTDKETMIFLTEGDSAIGQLINVRDQDLHGGYPLRGKFLTTWKMPAAKQLENKEIFEILAILGLTIGDLDISNMQYKYIAIMTDADVDGVGSIYPSLLCFFSQWPALFEQDRIRFIKTPLIILDKKGQEDVWFYDAEEYEAVKDQYKGWGERYIKGLGSLREDDTHSEYSRVINDQVYEIVKLPENANELFELLYGPNADARKEWMSY